MISDPAIPSEPVNDLNIEKCVTELEADPSEPVMDLKSEVFSAKLEAEPTAPERTFPGPLV